jgi:hypothetical protein
MKFCPVVPEICHGQVHMPKKERRKRRIIIIIRNGAKTIINNSYKISGTTGQNFMKLGGVIDI